MKIYAVAVAALALGGCATVTRGTSNQVTFNSQPSNAQVRTSVGHSCETPCTITVDRKAEFIATFTKEGYEDVQVPVGTRVANAGMAGAAGNILLGGGIGLVADVATGATLEHFPNPVMAEMRPLGRPSTSRARRSRRPESQREPEAPAM